MARQRIEQEYAVKELTLDHELTMAKSRAAATHETGLLDLERDRIRTAIDNDQSPGRVQAKLIDALPDIAARLPKPAELKSVHIGGTDSTTVAGLVAELGAVIGALQSALPRKD